MEEFLIASKAAVNDPTKYEGIKVVLGNCTCDLDSAISALVQAFFHYNQVCKDAKDKGRVAVVPVMNIKEKEFRIKTEVVWFLGENGIDPTLLTFRDQIDLYGLAERKKLQLILVDHHTLSSEDLVLADSVVEIIDHRPRDPAWPWPKARLTIDRVGSCATLITNNILKENSTILDNAGIRGLLRGAILVDTENLSVEAGRAEPLDHEMLWHLEKLEPSIVGREEIFRKILDAKTNVSGLTGRDLLMKDLKVIDDIAIPGFTILVEQFMDLPNAMEDIRSFAGEGAYGLVLLLGMNLGGEKRRRDLGLFVPASTIGGREDKILSKLRESDLELETVSEIRDEGYKFFLLRQNNTLATRKRIIPIVRSALDSHR